MKIILLMCLMVGLVGCEKSNNQKALESLTQEQVKLEKELKEQEYVANKHLKPCKDGVVKVEQLKLEGKDDAAQQVANEASSHCEIAQNALKKTQEITLSLLELMPHEAMLEKNEK